MAGLLDFVSRHFTHAAPILVIGAFGLVIILERLHAIIWDYSFPYGEAFFEKIRFMVLSDRLAEAIAFCEQLAHKPLVRVVREGLLRAHQPESVVEHGLQIAVGEATEKILERTPYLATIANVATLMGLFGTIFGLIQAFEAVGSANAQERAILLASGISVAMNATMMGLAVAIPCLLCYSFIVNKSNRLVAEIDIAAIRTLDLIKQRYYAAPPKADGTPGMPAAGVAATRVTRTGRGTRGF